MKEVSSIQELIRVIGANSSEERMPVEIKIWDNEGVVRGSKYEGSEKPEVISAGAGCIDSNLLWSHVKNLLKRGKSFIVSNGQILFEWTISEN